MNKSYMTQGCCQLWRWFIQDSTIHERWCSLGDMNNNIRSKDKLKKRKQLYYLQSLQ